jgi:hypothetical protein
MHYFGPWDDADGALTRWLEQKDDLLAGRVPRAKVSEGVTLRDLCNRFLTTKTMLRDNGELSPRSFQDYHDMCERLVKEFGRGPEVVPGRPTDSSHYRLEWRIAHSAGAEDLFLGIELGTNLGPARW